MNCWIRQVRPAVERAIYGQFRAGKRIFDLSLDYRLPYSEIERIIRSGMDLIERSAANRPKGNKVEVITVAADRMRAAGPRPG